MKISIITEKKEWVTRRAARELCGYIPGCEIGGDYANADLVYLMPYTKINEVGEIKGKLVTLFTHYEKDNAKKKALWEAAISRTDAMVYMCLQAVKDKECLLKPTRIIHWGTDLNTNNLPKKFGVVGKARPRKRPEFVAQLVQDGFTVLTMGEGWPSEAVNYFGCDKHGRADFYKIIDYLIVTSELEGGPVPVLDAIACGVPVIAPDVGWCWEYPVIPYDGTYQHLKRICGQLDCTRAWDDFCEEHKVYFERLVNAKD